MSTEYGFLLPNKTRIVHGAGSAKRDAFPAHVGIPGQLQTFSGGHANDPSSTPCFCGPQGILPFTTETRMPRHVHMSAAEPTSTNTRPQRRYVVEKIMVMDGVAVAELGGEIYVIPPYTLVLIGAGVPHTWTACPEGIDFGELGFGAGDDDGHGEDEETAAAAAAVSTGRFVAVFEYEAPTAFYPTAQIETLTTEEDYVRCEDLHSIRIPSLTAAELKGRAWFVWGKEARKLAGGGVDRR